MNPKFNMLCWILLWCPVSFLCAQQPADWGNEDRWESLNPGGGGQIQDLYFDKNVDGRVWFSSDMEGVYRSDDYGQQWHFVSRDLSHGMAFVINQTIGENKTFQGGLYGAHISTNADAADPHEVTWDMIEITRGDAIASIAISADNQTIILAPGWQNKDPQKCQQSLLDPVQNLSSTKFNGERNIYLSKDGGQSWQSVLYDAEEGYRNIFAVNINPINDHIYIAAGGGLYLSTDGGSNFTKVAEPNDALIGAGAATSCNNRPDGGSRGVSVSPDGKVIYASFQTTGGGTYLDKRWALYAMRTTSTGLDGSWLKIMDGLTDTAEWYDPKVDPRSTATAHRLAVGTVWNNNANRIGLWEAEISLDENANIISYQWSNVLDMPKSGRCFDFEVSWERRNFIVRSVDYSPASWKDNLIVTMGGMNVFITDRNDVGYPCSSWREIYGEVVYYHEGLAMSRERGFSSPYSYDVSAYENYMIQGCADHGIIQSLDHGYSWTSEHTPQGITNAMGVATIPTTPALVVADMRKGYGAPSHNVGGLFAKEINLESIGQKTDWKLIGGGAPNSAGEVNGLPSRNFRAIVYDPHHVERVFISTRGKTASSGDVPGGIYTTDDILAVYNGTGSFRKISDPSVDFLDIRDIWVDPNDANYLFARTSGTGSGASLYRGVRDASGNYSWTSMEANCRNAGDVYLFTHKGDTWAVMAAELDGHYGVYINRDPRADNWHESGSWIFTDMDIAASLALRPEKWIEPNEPIAFSGLAAHEDFIVLTTGVGTHKKGLGTFLGQINGDRVDWYDWSVAPANNRSLENPTGLQAKIHIENGTPYYMVALATTGPWRRQLPSALLAPPCDVRFPSSSVNYAAVGGAETISISSDEAVSLGEVSEFITADLQGTQLNISVAPNHGSARTGTVELIGCKTRFLTIVQAGNGAIIETFDLMPTTNQWTDGQFTGNEGVVWNYLQVKRTSSINGNSVKVDNSAGGAVYAQLSGGLTRLVFKVMPTGTANPTGVVVEVDGAEIYRQDIAANSGISTITIEDLEITGDYELRFSGFNNADLQIDDIEWLPTPLEVSYPLTVTNGSGSGFFAEGETIGISADQPADGMVFTHWSGDVAQIADASQSTTSLIMPASAVAVTANYQAVSLDFMETFDLMPVANQWSDGVFTGNHAQAWAYHQVKRTKTIHENTLKLGNSTGGYLETAFTDGLGSLSFLLAPTGTAQPTGVDVYVNGVLVEQFFLAANSPATLFKIDGINQSGNCTLKFVGNSNSDPQLDDIAWSAFGNARQFANEVPAASLSCYPNPVSGQLKVVYPQQTMLQIFNSVGQLVHQSVHDGESVIHTEDWPAGIYIVRTGDEQQKILKK
ncbi:InlB B-repeat-containing protein [Persicobacter psychrovividus]|uniref:T9SS type A sorting domain-containing protein n=1 Tax=Persicobacter psychrovividus TaxID=387638 RepID=A0ABM7VI78_9BACT|nr:hypothetical protein PEPS_29660 [Persicobacter psychrovividus]